MTAQQAFAATNEVHKKPFVELSLDAQNKVLEGIYQLIQEAIARGEYELTPYADVDEVYVSGIVAELEKRGFEAAGHYMLLNNGIELFMGLQVSWKMPKIQ